MALEHQVSIGVKQWLRDSHCLFDFEATGKDMECWDLSMQTRGLLYKDGDRISDNVGAGRPVLQWRPNGAGLDVAPTKLSSTNSSAWLVVKDLSEGLNRIAEGDVIQLGREILCVRQLAKKTAAIRPDLFGETCLPCDTASEAQCRICLMDGATCEDPFVRPCACTGSIANVHVGCLRQWAKTKHNISDDFGDKCKFRKPACEMCKRDYPARIYKDGASESLLDLPTVQGPFLVLESAGKGRKAGHKEREAAFHVVSFANLASASIGRGRDCTVRLDEGSMSRWHASICFKDGEFYLEDNGSKYGTLLGMRHTWTLAPGETLPVKIGRAVLSIAMPQAGMQDGCSSRGLSARSGSSSNLDSLSEGNKSDVEI